ncbi:hypothetical protein FAVG1_00783 [Fusarium avenaceum]|nr:hypothetical protein FAVG1_00783 [Fusarium avenaceum]
MKINTKKFTITQTVGTKDFTTEMTIPQWVTGHHNDRNIYSVSRVDGVNIDIQSSYRMRWTRPRYMKKGTCRVSLDNAVTSEIELQSLDED